ncbi:PIN domain-containing protein [Phyllobacterium sp. SYP-B3895]|uniref:type II toxin-antitoxin system VapC family toxin n=1 Tax=Phyllobacterium sp. SYP-B3895 TaxID=2663240 RepID=UPI001299978D|nr:PIN domain nuclease [Phyllobacterium sp. SYP-B3895]MRG56551.1 PIN domain-containing protein [Phyllobacterium sp. SYP-B3895]
MIVVDSSGFIAHMRNELVPPVQKLRSISDLSTIIVGDIVLLELLQGTRTDAAAAALEARLRRFEVRNMLSTRIAIEAARNYRQLRQRGITIRRTIDMIIATYCINEGHYLLHHDRDFAPMAEHLGLKVL